MPAGENGSTIAWNAVYGIRSIRSTAGGPMSSLSGRSTSAPSSASPAYIARMPSTGVPCTSGGTNGSGGASRTPSAVQTDSGACSTQSRQARATSPAFWIGWTTMPAMTIGPSSYSLNSYDVTTPKFAPAPRRPQSSSGFSSSLAVTTRPSAVTTSAEIRLSQAKPYLVDVQA